MFKIVHLDPPGNCRDTHSTHPRATLDSILVAFCFLYNSLAGLCVCMNTRRS